MATEENYQENQETENNDPAAEQKPSRRSQREGMSVPLFSVI